MRRFVAFLCLALALAACATDARELAETDRTTPPSTTTTTVAVQDSGGLFGSMQLTSPAFDAGGEIPEAFTCDGADRSPPLAWSGVPPGTTELAVVIVDPDTDGFVHWVISGLDPATTGIAAGAVPAGAIEATNDAGTEGWTGPCPPAGEAPHAYEVTLYALGRSPALEPGGSPEAAITAIGDAALTSTLLLGTY